MFSIKNNVFLNLVPFIPIKFKTGYLSLLNRKMFFSKIKQQKLGFLSSLFFSRKIYFIRYLNRFLLGFISSKLFVYKIKLKLCNFLKGNLLFEKFSSDLFIINEAAFNLLIILILHSCNILLLVSNYIIN